MWDVKVEYKFWICYSWLGQSFFSMWLTMQALQHPNSSAPYPTRWLCVWKSCNVIFKKFIFIVFYKNTGPQWVWNRKLKTGPLPQIAQPCRTVEPRLSLLPAPASCGNNPVCSLRERRRCCWTRNCAHKVPWYRKKNN